MVTRTVVVLCGPPGAGKTTAARASGLMVFDRDDPSWISERQFTDEIAKLATNLTAQAVVIRSGATSSARARAAALVNATHVLLVLAEQPELVARIKRRGRHDTQQTVAGVKTWFNRFERNDGVSDFKSWDRLQEPDLGISSEDW